MLITGPELISPADLAGMIDHTLLVPTATTSQVICLCEEAVEYGFASVCIPPLHVPLAVRRLYGSTVHVGTVVGFPCGYSCLRQKVQEAADLVAVGANEIDMVVSLSYVLENKLDLLEEEIAQVVMAAPQAIVKVIIECCYLDRAQKVAATHAAMAAGADYVKTSTGFGPAGATIEDVALLAEVAGGKIRVKAAGGIRTLAVCRELVSAGASRIGTSSGVLILNQWQQQPAG